jgi:hypothetical protein
MTTTASPDTLLYDVVDALHIDLFEVGDRWRGFDTRKLEAGPWKIDANITVVGHLHRADLVTFFVKVVGGLWLYVVSQAREPLLMCVLDGPVLKLKVDEVAGFPETSLKGTMEKLSKGLVTAFEFQPTSNKREEINAEPRDLDESQPAKNAVPALAAPQVLSKH